jgi:hypothetical protein
MRYDASHGSVPMLVVLWLMSFQIATSAEPQLIAERARGADEVRVHVESGIVVIDVFSRNGIGQITVKSGGQPWPMKAKVRLRYDATNPFTDLEGFTLTDSKSRLQTSLSSASVETSFLDKIKRNSAVKPKMKVIKTDRAIEVDLPMEWLGDEKKFTIHWIDFYRG